MATTTSTTMTLTEIPLPPLTHAQTPTSPSRVVRFDTECVLIPQPHSSGSKLPLVLTKSYSLPLWRKSPSKTPLSPIPTEENGSPEEIRPRSPTIKEERVVIKVPIPLFRRRSSRSPGPTVRSLSTSPIVPRAPLPSCLVHQHPPSGSLNLNNAASSPPHTPLRPLRRVSLPPPLSSHKVGHNHNDPYATPLLTVPLRPCCAACEAATDHALAEGDAWKAHFTRGAKRRRSASLEQPLSLSGGAVAVGSSATAAAFASLSSSSHASTSSSAAATSPPASSPFATKHFAGLSVPLEDDDDDVQGTNTNPSSSSTSAGLHIIHNPTPAAAMAFALRVDEVDKRRRSMSFEFTNEEEHYAMLRRTGVALGAHDHGASPSSSASNIASSSSSASSSAARPSSSPTRDLDSGKNVVYGGKHEALLSPEGYNHIARLRASPIAEEEEERSRSVSAASSMSNLSVSANGSRNGSNLSVSSAASSGSRRSSGGSVNGVGIGIGNVTGRGKSRRRTSGQPNVACKPEVGDVDDELFPLPGGSSPSRSPSPRGALGGGKGSESPSSSVGGASPNLSAGSTSGEGGGETDLLEAVQPLGRKSSTNANANANAVNTPTPSTTSKAKAQQQLGRGALSLSVDTTGATANGLGRRLSGGSSAGGMVSPKGPRAQTPVGTKGSGSTSALGSASASTTNASDVSSTSATDMTPSSVFANHEHGHLGHLQLPHLQLHQLHLQHNSASSEGSDSTMHQSSPAPPSSQLSQQQALPSQQAPQPQSQSHPQPQSPRSPTTPKTLPSHLPPQSPTKSSRSPQPHQRRKHSFTAPFVKAGGVLRDAGADVLRGVSGLGMAGGVGGG